MDGPRLTEERLRNHLDSNQPAREGMCLALLPILGNYTRERPRRPKGGPDGGRDIEAMYDGALTIWCAVGFRNGGGSDEAARKDASEKFRDDLKRMLEETPRPQGFVFFTNVDLTPTQKELLSKHARDQGMRHAEVFDFERLRHALDSAEGLIPRLQYLEIPMTTTEQVALAAKYGADLQKAVSARFDRVERTLAQMEDFLAFHKPIFQLGLHLEFFEPRDSLDGGAIAFAITGLRELNETIMFLCTSAASLPPEGVQNVRLYSWFTGGFDGDDDHEDPNVHHDFMEHAITRNSSPTSLLVPHHRGFDRLEHG